MSKKPKDAATIDSYLYTDLAWNGEERFTLSLEHLCIYWNMQRLLSQNNFKIGQRVRAKKIFSFSNSKKKTIFYTHILFSEWLTQTYPQFQTKAKANIVRVLTAITLVQNAQYITCKELLQFYEKKFPSLYTRHAEKHFPPASSYERSVNPDVLPIIKKTFQVITSRPDALSLFTRRK